MPLLHYTNAFGFLMIVSSGCVTVDPHWSREFDGAGYVEGDLLRVVQENGVDETTTWVAIRARIDDGQINRFDLEHQIAPEGWFVMRCKLPAGRYDERVSTGNDTLRAWFIKAPRLEFAKDYSDGAISHFNVWMLSESVFRQFRENPNDERFRENIVSLAGTIRLQGTDNIVKTLEGKLTCRDDTAIRFDGSVTRRWRLFRVNLILI